MNFLTHLWTVALACFILNASGQSASSGLHLGFNDSPAGEVPAQMTLDNIPPAGAIRVVDIGSDPADPFGGAGNRSLLMDKSDEGVAPIALFRTDSGYSRGEVTFRYYPDMTVSQIPTRAFVHLQGNGEVALMLQFIGGKPSYIGSDDNRARNFDQIGRTTESNEVVLEFDLSKAVFRGTLNGEPLSIKGETEFPLRAVPAEINEISLRVSTNQGPVARAFFDDLTLTGALPGGASAKP